MKPFLRLLTLVTVIHNYNVMNTDDGKTVRWHAQNVSKCHSAGLEVEM